MITLVDISRLRRSQLNIYAADPIYNCLEPCKIHFEVTINGNAEVFSQSRIQQFKSAECISCIQPIVRVFARNLHI